MSSYCPRPTTKALSTTGVALGVLALGAAPAFAAAVPDVWQTYDPAWCSGPCAGHPVTVNDEAEVEAGGQIVLDVLANDYPQPDEIIIVRRALDAGDESADELTLLEVGNVQAYDQDGSELPSVGTLDVVDNRVHYQAPDLAAGSAGAHLTFMYVAQDADGQRTPGWGWIAIQPAAVTVVADDDRAGVPFETATTISALSNDSSSDGSPLTITSATAPAHGHVAIRGGEVRYTPNPGYIGPDEFTYTVQSGTASASATVRLEVRAPNAPAPADDTARVGYQGTVDVDVLANDTSFDASELTLVEMGTAQHGHAGIVNGKLRFTAADRFAGQTTVTYTVADRTGARSTAVLSVTVEPPAGPQTAADTLKLTAGPSGGPVRVLLNDTSPVGAQLRLVATTDGQHGTVAISGDEVIYTPAVGYSGPDTFTYTVEDEFGSTAVGTVEVLVEGEGAAVTAAQEPPTLPVTGTQTATGATLAAGLIGAGVAMVSAARRRGRRRGRHAA
jgi:Bacterial Ig domain